MTDADLGPTLKRLIDTLEARRGGDPAQSWSARLIANPLLAAKKLAEEAVETALAAAVQDRSAVIAESADLIYHWLALLAALGIDPDEVGAELAAREGRSGVAEKAARGA
jgi:phosphoribosyl-ATP pyrophosphohydrolase